MHRRTCVAAILILVVADTACATTQPREGLPGTGVAQRQLAIPAADYGGGYAWLPSGWIVVSWYRNPTAPGPEATLWRARPEDRALKPLSVPTDDRCFRTSLLYPSAMPDGRVAFVRVCQHRSLERQDTVTVEAIDVTTGEVSTLTDPLTRLPKRFAWDPRSDRAVASENSQICAGIATLTRRGLEAFRCPCPREASPTGSTSSSTATSPTAAAPRCGRITPRGRRMGMRSPSSPRPHLSDWEASPGSMRRGTSTSWMPRPCAPSASSQAFSTLGTCSGPPTVPGSPSSGSSTIVPGCGSSTGNRSISTWWWAGTPPVSRGRRT